MPSHAIARKSSEMIDKLVIPLVLGSLGIIFILILHSIGMAKPDMTYNPPVASHSTNIVTEVDANTDVVTIKKHEYIRFYTKRGCSIIHSESCECRK